MKCDTVAQVDEMDALADVGKAFSMSKTNTEIVADIRALAEKCLDIATDADHYGGNNADMLRVARVLLAGSAALIALADGVDKQ